MNEALLEFTAGWIGGAAGLVVGHPLDTVKVRLQSLKYTSVFECMSKTLNNESWHGFYKGMFFPMMSAGLLHSLYFGAYGATIRVLFPQEQKRLIDSASSTSNHVPYSHVFVASIAGGLLQWVPSCPIEVVKIKLQVQNSARSIVYRSPFHCFMKVFEAQGLKGLYRGGVILLYRDVIAFSSYLPTYEYIGRGLNDKTKNDLLKVTLAGGVAGVVSWLTILPLDMIKSRLQSDLLHRPLYKGILDCAGKTYRSEGLAFFYRGWFMVSCRAFPVNAVIFLAYDKFKAHFCFEFK